MVVVDASLAVKWMVTEDYTVEARALEHSWEHASVRIVAPHLLPMEVANVLHKKVVRGEFVLDVATQLMRNFLATGVELVHEPVLHTRAIELASQFGQGAVYDSHYLALAELPNCELWTADERFHRATRMFPKVRWIGSI